MKFKLEGHPSLKKRIQFSCQPVERRSPLDDTVIPFLPVRKNFTANGVKGVLNMSREQVTQTMSYLQRRGYPIRTNTQMEGMPQYYYDPR